MVIDGVGSSKEQLGKDTFGEVLSATAGEYLVAINSEEINEIFQSIYISNPTIYLSYEGEANSTLVVSSAEEDDTIEFFNVLLEDEEYRIIQDVVKKESTQT